MGTENSASRQGSLTEGVKAALLSASPEKTSSAFEAWAQKAKTYCLLSKNPDTSNDPSVSSLKDNLTLAFGQEGLEEVLEIINSAAQNSAE